jgi:hypothetical protein
MRVASTDEVRANNTQTVDITKVSPENVDFHIEVE